MYLTDLCANYSFLADRYVEGICPNCKYDVSCITHIYKQAISNKLTHSKLQPVGRSW